MIRALFGIICLCIPALAVAAQPPLEEAQIDDLDQLLQVVREQRQVQRNLNRQREAEFLADRDRQRARLQEQRRILQQRESENRPLLEAAEANATQITQLEQQLAELVEGMGDFRSAFSEFAGDFSAVLGESMVSVQFPRRREQLQDLAATEGEPDIEQIESLWLLVQEEMTEAGKVARLSLPVVAVDGATEERELVRVGVFSAFSREGFLRYIPETGELLALSRQPGERYQSVIRDFFNAAEKRSSAVVDPTRGSLLGMLSYTPTLRERIDQGGSIGLIILGLGALGLLLTAWRSLYLGLVYLKLQRQLGEIDTPRENNPLGRVLLSVQGVDLAEDELLQLKLDEAVLAEIPALERGSGLIKLLAATSPLLGLLGTVTGMILTFQAISLFGTSDPKLMAGGISQALVTTVLGLVVAIPLLFGHSLVSTLARGLIQRLDEQCAGVLARSIESGSGT